MNRRADGDVGLLYLATTFALSAYGVCARAELRHGELAVGTGQRRMLVPVESKIVSIRRRRIRDDECIGDRLARDIDDITVNDACLRRNNESDGRLLRRPDRDLLRLRQWVLPVARGLDLVGTRGNGE